MFQGAGVASAQGGDGCVAVVGGGHVVGLAVVGGRGGGGEVIVGLC